MQNGCNWVTVLSDGRVTSSHEETFSFLSRELDDIYHAHEATALLNCVWEVRGWLLGRNTD
jgi:hypothetical protein